MGASPYQPIPFGTHTAESRSGEVSLERVTNWYPEQAPPKARSSRP